MTVEIYFAPLLLYFRALSLFSNAVCIINANPETCKMCHVGAWTEGRLAVFRTEDPENFIFFPGCGTMMEDRKSRRSAYAGTWTDRVFPFRREEASRLIRFVTECIKEGRNEGK